MCIFNLFSGWFFVSRGSFLFISMNRRHGDENDKDCRWIWLEWKPKHKNKETNENAKDQSILQWQKWTLKKNRKHRTQGKCHWKNNYEYAPSLSLPHSFFLLFYNLAFVRNVPSVLLVVAILPFALIFQIAQKITFFLYVFIWSFCVVTVSVFVVWIAKSISLWWFVHAKRSTTTEK